MALLDNALEVAIAGIVIGAVTIPILMSVNTDDWSPTNITIWPFVQTFLVLSLLLGTIYGAMKR